LEQSGSVLAVAPGCVVPSMTVPPLRLLISGSVLPIVMVCGPAPGMPKAT
jgi:hypothetical protein